MTKKILNDIECYPFVEPLFSRIAYEYVKQKRKQMKIVLVVLVICILIGFHFEIGNEMYNHLKGPFHMNSNQFIKHIQLYNKQTNILNKKSLLFYKKYFQIELGEDNIEEYVKYPYLHKINQSIVNKYFNPNYLYVKFSREEQSYYQNYKLFNFNLFSIKTLKCIIDQLKLSTYQFEKWKSIKIIEDFYDKNGYLFNKIVSIKCGIIIGYFYNPKDKFSLYNLNSSDIIIDVSFSYSSILFNVIGIIFILILFCNIILLINYYIYPNKIKLNKNLKKQFQILNINSINCLSKLINKSIENDYNYDYRMFIIERKYLIIFNIDLYEYDINQLKLFFNKSPFIIIPILSIIEINKDQFCIKDENNNKKWIYFPSIYDNINIIQMNKWLHNKLMNINENYHSNYLERIRENKNQLIYIRRFNSIRSKEQQIRLNLSMKDIEYTPIDFIVKFRLTDHRIIKNNNINLLNNKCCICLNKFNIGIKYVQWPCQRSHYFHYDCMLKTMRYSNKCPLCQFIIL